MKQEPQPVKQACEICNFVCEVGNKVRGDKASDSRL